MHDIVALLLSWTPDRVKDAQQRVSGKLKRVVPRVKEIEFVFNKGKVFPGGTWSKPE